MTASNKRQKREEYRKAHRDEAGSTQLPKKRFYRQRAHANPFSDHQLTYPISPDQMDWSPYFPAFVDQNAAKDVADGQPKPLTKQVTVADIGCGFGGLLVTLAPMLPDELILGMEIRTQVTEYVQDRISALRAQHAPPTSNRKVAFPSYVVHNDSYVPFDAVKPKEDTVQYIIHSTANSQEDELKNTEDAIRQVIGTDKILSAKLALDPKLWVANLTKQQMTELSNLDGIQSIEENQIPQPDLNNGITPRYYNPSTTTLTLTPPSPPYANISVLRANTMKFLPNFFTRSQLTTIFLCFPDPHFKARKHKARIVSSTLCAEYAYVLRPGGCIYTITDVEELAGWMRERFREFGDGEVFMEVQVPEEGREGEWIDGDGGGERGEVARLVRCIREETEEGKKVKRNGGVKFVSVWRRREDPRWPDEVDEVDED